jgi:predicted nucleic acid-binding protein
VGLFIDTSVWSLALRRGASFAEAAELRNTCRRNGIQVGTVGALLAQVCRRHDLVLLSTDRAFESMARHVDLRLWTA